VRPTLVLNPRHDARFEATAGALLDGATTPSDLEFGLRVAYPDAVVHARDLSSEAGTVWYVYRDGHWINSGEGAEGVTWTRTTKIFAP